MSGHLSAPFLDLPKQPGHDGESGLLAVSGKRLLSLTSAFFHLGLP
jgi:hypothetical protein